MEEDESGYGIQKADRKVQRDCRGDSRHSLDSVVTPVTASLQTEFCAKNI